MIFLFRTPAVVTLWGKLADAFGADKLQRWSAQEPIIVLFVGMSVYEFNVSTYRHLISILHNLDKKLKLPVIFFVQETWPSSPVNSMVHKSNYF